MNSITNNISHVCLGTINSHRQPQLHTKKRRREEGREEGREEKKEKRRERGREGEEGREKGGRREGEEREIRKQFYKYRRKIEK